MFANLPLVLGETLALIIRQRVILLVQRAYR